MKHGHFQTNSFCDEKNEYFERSEKKWHMVHNYTAFLYASGSESKVNSIAIITHIKTPVPRD